ncbi:MAG: Hyaluronan synthase [Polyangiaceae bacterium]|jgi:cellulose synthase/poly-beta-1,6-N-acetylglucosamine synthase-like glycosyltransferase|nr:Hyaluronan synthase [Polyangiaceae bacterium]
MAFVVIALLVLIVITNRYLAGTVARKLMGDRLERKVAYQPTVDVIIPMFNEGRGIESTVLSLLAQNYPADKLRVMVVDDCSTDDSLFWARKAAAQHPDRAMVIKNKVNVGKRVGIAHAVRRSEAEVIVSVDSDVVVHPDAVRELVARFVSDDIAAVGGRVNVSNPNDNWLTQMQTIKYHFGYGYLKSLERAFQTVMCLSGCLTAYRRTVLLKLEPVLEGRNLLGVPIKYGEDRFLTRQIVKAGYRTVLTMDANCWTVAPNTLAKYFSQQLRWRRSNFIDYMMGITHIWRVNPFVAVHYISLFALQFSYPLVVVLHIFNHTFWEVAAIHTAILLALGALYRWEVRNLPAEQKVNPWSFAAMGVVMPVSYIVLNVLAFWTLDSGSWETRGHVVPGRVADADPSLSAVV